MELNHVTSILLITMAMTLAVTCALPSPSSWYNPETAGDLENTNDEGGSEYGPVLDKLRLIMALRLLRQQTPTGELVEAGANDKETKRAKRINFGFAGLDNMDHILSTLDRKEGSRSPGSSRILQNMQGHGYKGASLRELEAMMRNAG